MRKCQMYATLLKRAEIGSTRSDCYVWHAASSGSHQEIQALGDVIHSFWWSTTTNQVWLVKKPEEAVLASPLPHLLHLGTACSLVIGQPLAASGSLQGRWLQALMRSHKCPEELL